MLLLVLKKLAANRWLALCLLAGVTIAVTLAAGVPVYTQGILQRMLTRDLEIFQEQNHYFPGRYTISISFYYASGEESNVQEFPAYDREVRRRLLPEVGLPALASAALLTVDFLQAAPAIRREEDLPPRFFMLQGLEGAGERLKIIHGRMFANREVDGVIEVVVTEEAFKNQDLLLDEVYLVKDLRDMLPAPLKVRVVGVFGMQDPGDPWWFQSLRNYDSTMLADFDLMRSLFADPPTPLLTGVTWSWALDYHAIRLADLRRLIRVLERQQRELDENLMSYELQMMEILKSYLERERTLTTTLWFLQVPVFVLLAFFVFMTSQLLVRHDANEIAVLKSRGTRSWQIFVAYLLEGALLAAVAMVIGPPLGLVVCQVVGAANGFLEFVQRAALPAALSPRAWLSGAACAVLAVATMLAPAVRASRTTIVIAKQRRSRAVGAPLWRRAFLDLVLLAISAYGYYGYRTQQRVLALTRVEAGTLPIDPLLFLISACFVLGAGLLCLRLYPLLVGLVFRLGRKAWPPGLYATFLGVARGGGQEQFLMLFLVLTLAIGVLDAKAARTVNRNIEERIRYAAGADVTLQEDWPTNKPKAAPYQAMPGMPGPPGDAAEKGPVIYREPDFAKYRALAGVEQATKVFVRRWGFAYSSQGVSARVLVMGVVPNEFASVAWFRVGLLPYHWYQYLNLLAQSPKAMLVSDGLAKKLGLAPGESVGITWEDQDYAEGMVYATVPFWPTWNPLGEDLGEPPGLVVANLSYLHAAMAIEPYQVWMKLAPGASSADLYRELEEQQVSLVKFENAGQALVAAKNDPLVQGTNGALTLGFTITLLVSVIGFLIYWTLAVHSRLLQFGVLRAMGLSRRRVLGMLAWEQLLVSAVAVAIGVAVGGAAGDLFVPLLQLTSSAAQQVPPFRVISEPADYLKLYVVVGAMLAAGLAALGVTVSRLRIAQAIKLGEE